MEQTQIAPDCGQEGRVGLRNFAGRADVDTDCEGELAFAGITVEKLPEICRKNQGEVKTIIVGTLHGWVFERAWRYWVCKGPGIPLDAAMALHARSGRVVRVDGHCGCPSPLEWFHGLGTGAYHVDTVYGLKDLADTIKAVVEQSNRKLTGA